MLAVLLGSLLAGWSGWQANRSISVALWPLFTWAIGFALALGGISTVFSAHAMADHAAMARAAALSLLIGHVVGLGLLKASPGHPATAGFGLAMALGLPPLGAFAGLWLGLQTLQAALLLLPAWPSLLLVAGGLMALAGWVGVWRGGVHWVTTATPSESKRFWRRLLLIIGLIGGFLPWLWVLPAQVIAGSMTGELPLLLVALGMMLTPVIPGQASVIPFGLLALAMAFLAVLRLVLRFSRRAS
jgi:hypothetical protein